MLAGIFEVNLCLRSDVSVDVSKKSDDGTIITNHNVMNRKLSQCCLYLHYSGYRINSYLQLLINNIKKNLNTLDGLWVLFVRCRDKSFKNNKKYILVII